VIALGKLRQDLIAMGRLLRRARPSGGAALTNWRRLEAAIAAWEQALVSEQRSLASARALAPRTSALDARARTRGVSAMKDLARFAASH
jgi:hypothetical protein